MWMSVSPLLRTALLADAVASGGSGLLLAAAHEPLSQLFGLPAAALLAAGLFTIAYGLFVAVLGRRPRLPRWLVGLVIGGNLLWAAGSILLLFEPGLSPTAWGVAYVVAQAVVVAALAELQFFGLRRSVPLPMGAMNAA